MKRYAAWNKLLHKNNGITLIEILVVVAIMSIITGSAGLSMALAYSRDAEKCAKTINAALESARMKAMSEQGIFVLKLDMANKELTITQTTESEEGTSVQNVVYEEKLQNRVNIYLSVGDSSATEVTVQFDKSTGRVSQMTSGTAEGILKITAENSSGKKATVVLVKGTGKHYVEYK